MGRESITVINLKVTLLSGAGCFGANFGRFGFDGDRCTGAASTEEGCTDPPVLARNALPKIG